LIGSSSLESISYKITFRPKDSKLMHQYFIGENTSSRFATWVLLALHSACVKTTQSLDGTLHVHICIT
jgi:hypothetical protein